MAAGIYHLGLTFVWTETKLNLLGKTLPDVPLAFLGRASKYEPHFKQLQQQQPDESGLMLPWPKQSGERFWQFYFKRKRAGDITARQAWKGLAPFRTKLPITLGAQWLPGYGTCEGFFHPFGYALVTTVRVRSTDPLPLNSVVAIAHKARRQGSFEVSVRDHAAGTMSLDVLSDYALKWIREQAHGEGATAGSVTGQPFSVATFMHVADVAPSSLEEEGTVHRALEALTGWATAWPTIQLQKLSAALIKTMQPDPSDVLYHDRRGRALWFPRHAIEDEGFALGCYHRNVVYASLQVESLGRFLQETVSGGYLGPIHEECARNAAGVLSRLYGGADSTYRSRSCQVHIQENDFMAPINEVRQKFDMAPIT